MTAIRQWQRLAHELARENGEHSVVCPTCDGTCKPNGAGCPECNGTGRIEVDHKSPTRIASRLALIHLAISRAVECVVKGEMGIHWTLGLGKLRANEPIDAPRVAGTFGPGSHSEQQCLEAGWKPQGFPIALADAFMRLCDLAEGLGLEIPVLLGECAHSGETDEEIEGSLSKLHAVVSEPEIFGRGFHPEFQRAQWAGRVYRKLNAIAFDCDVDLFAMAELKYAYEKGRAK